MNEERKDAETTVTVIEEDFVEFDEKKKDHIDAYEDEAKRVFKEPEKREFTNKMQKVDFTQDELREFSEELARVHGEMQEQEAEKKEIASQYKARRLTIVRLDTGEVVQERAMTVDELQVAMDIK